MNRRDITEIMLKAVQAKYIKTFLTHLQQFSKIKPSVGKCPSLKIDRDLTEMNI